MGALIGQDAGFSLLVPATKATHIHGVASKEYREGKKQTPGQVFTQRKGTLLYLRLTLLNYHG